MTSLLQMVLFLFIVFIFLSTAVNDNDFGESEEEYDPIVSCETSQGLIRIQVYPDWAPIGASRFLDLVRDNFFTDIAFFRCVKGFLTQFGISDNPEKKHWHRETIQDDTDLHVGIKKNYVSFAGGGKNSRSTQIFIAFEDLPFLGDTSKSPWETPFGEVIEGQSTLDALYKGYGDIPPFGKGPDQQKIHNKGNQYIRDNFPNIDFLYSCVIEENDEELEEEELEKEFRMEGFDPVSIKQNMKDYYKQKKEKQLRGDGYKGKTIINKYRDDFYRKNQKSAPHDINFAKYLLYTAVIFFSCVFLFYLYLTSHSSQLIATRVLQKVN